MPLPSISSMLPSMPSYFKTLSDEEILDSIKSPDDFIRNRHRILNMNQTIISGKGCTPLHLAAKYHPESVKALLQAKANPNTHDNLGWTPLQLAARYHPKSIGELLNAGANPNIQDNKGWTPLHSAARHHPKFIGELLHAGANPNVQTNDGWTPLQLATRSHPESIGPLLNGGANPNIQNKKGWTPLHSAARYHPESIGQLLRAGANPNIQNNDNWTPLQIAARYHTKFIKELLKAGSNPNIQNKNGWTPLHSAALRDAPKEVIQDLIDYGAKTDLCNKAGKTFLEVAKNRDSYKDLKNVVIPTMREGIFCLCNKKELEEDLNLIYEPTNGTLYQNEGMVKLAVKSIIVFGATPFFVVGAMLQSLIYTVSDIASLFFNGRTIFKAEGTLALVKSIVLGIPKAIRDRVWEATKMPLHGLATMRYALYGLYSGNEARSKMNQAWGEGYLLKLSGMAPFGNLRDTVEGKMKFYVKELKN